MNEKAAKRLRRMVRMEAPNEYTTKTTYIYHNVTGQVKLGKCHRGVYQFLKRRIKLANRSLDNPGSTN